MRIDVERWEDDELYEQLTAEGVRRVTVYTDNDRHSLTIDVIESGFRVHGLGGAPTLFRHVATVVDAVREWESDRR